MLFFKSRKGVKITCKRKWGTRLGGFGMELDYAALGERIRQRRQEKGLTQNYVAEYIPHRARGVESRVKYAGKDRQHSGMYSERPALRQPGM